jgi:hypothetical protein
VTVSEWDSERTATITINHNGGGPLEECSVTSIGTPITRIEPERERTGNNRKTNIVSKKTIAVTVLPRI